MENKDAFLSSVREVLENKGAVILRRVEWPQSTLLPHLFFEGFLRANDNPYRLEKIPEFRWRVECGEIYEFTIQSVEISMLEMPSHHIAMRALDSQARSLHFTGRPDDLNSLLVELLTFNETVTQGLVPLTAYLHCWGVQGLITLLESGYGLFARGPEDLLKQYAAILERFGCKTSIYGEVQPCSDTYLGYHMLLWNRLSYVIADEFVFIREV
jgi:hypothetical protein